MADAASLALVAGTASSMVLGLGALWRSTRSDTRDADDRERRAEVTALQALVTTLQDTVQEYRASERQTREELATERQERSAEVGRLRAERVESDRRFYEQLAAVNVKLDSCEAGRADALEQLAARTKQLADATAALAGKNSQEADHGSPPPPT